MRGKASRFNKIVLVAGMGTSPAVLTETVWALAHQKRPVVPDEIVVLTTSTGKARLVKDVLSGEKSVWSQLKNALAAEKILTDGKLSFGAACIHVFPDAKGNESDDLRTGDDSLRAADKMLTILRGYTETPGTQILASIAGGRKTMSALLFSCMGLIGREEDRIYHVLIPPQYEGAMEPVFYFPQRGVKHRLVKTGKAVPSSKIGIELFEVPFVRMRGWYQEKFKQMPPSYSELIRSVQGLSPRAIVYPDLEIDFDGHGYVRILPERKEVKLSVQSMLVLTLLANGVSKENLGRVLHKLHSALRTESSDARIKWDEKFVQSPKFEDPENEKTNANDLADCMSEIREKLRRVNFPNPEAIAPKRNGAILYPLKKISFVNESLLAMDICGYLFQKG